MESLEGEMQAWKIWAFMLLQGESLLTLVWEEGESGLLGFLYILH